MHHVLSGRVAAALFAIAAVGSCGADSTAPVPTVKTVEITLGSAKVQAEIATTLAQREQGLMNRGVLPDTAGMLFVFGQVQTLSFWMKDTPVNLAIAFMDSAMTVLNIEEMTANDATNIHRSAGPARYALEVRQGWFASHGIVAGTKAAFTLPPGLTIDP